MCPCHPLHHTTDCPAPAVLHSQTQNLLIHVVMPPAWQEAGSRGRTEHDVLMWFMSISTSDSWKKYLCHCCHIIVIITSSSLTHLAIVPSLLPHHHHCFSIVRHQLSLSPLMPTQYLMLMIIFPPLIPPWQKLQVSS